MLARLRRVAQETGWRSNLLGVAILFVIVNVTFFPFIWGDRTLQESANQAPSLYNVGSRQRPIPLVAAKVLDPGSGAWFQEPQFAIEHRIIIEEREPPIWNPYIAYGTPLAADAQSQAYSPFAWIPIIWSNARAYDIFLVLRLFAGGVFGFLFLRLFIRFTPALAGAAAFMFTGYFWYFLELTHLSVEVLLPALLYSIERVLRRPGPGSAAFMALVVACLILGGMPESLALALVFGTVYAVCRIALDPSLRTAWRAHAPYLVLGTVVGFGVSAVMLIPLLEYVPISSNLHSGGHQGLETEPISWSALAAYLAPLYTRPLDIFVGSKGFFGCSALFFALTGFFSGITEVVKKRRAEGSTSVILLLGITAFMLLAKRFGAFFINWIGALPILHEVVFDKYEEAIIACCVALLAGFGVARLCEKRATTTSIWIAALIPLAILTAAAGETREAFLKLSQGQNLYTFGFAAALMFLALAAGAAAAFYAGRLKLSYFAGAALVLVVMEPLATYFIPLHYIMNEAAPQSVSALLGAPYIDYLESHMTGNDRLYAQDSLLYGHWSGAFGLDDVRGMDSFFHNRYLPFVRTFLTDRGPGGDNLASRFMGTGGDDMTNPMSQRFLALSSVRYVVTHGSDLTRTADFHKISGFSKSYDVDGIKIFQFQSPLPRISIFHRVVRVDTPEDALGQLKSSTFDPLSEAIAEGQSAEFSGLTGSRRSAVTAGRIEEYKATFVKAVVQTDSPAFVVLNDTNFPGWFASVDGRSAPLFYANYLFRGIIVPAGTHVIEYRYSPRSFAIGLALSLISLFVLGCMCLAGLVQNRRSRNAFL